MCEKHRPILVEDAALRALHFLVGGMDGENVSSNHVLTIGVIAAQLAVEDSTGIIVDVAGDVLQRLPVAA